jgi:hypothetical protein
MKTRTRITLTLAAVLLAGLSFALADEGRGFVGTWDAVTSTPDGEMSSVITLREVEGALKAEIEIAGLKRTVTDEKLDGSVLRMKVQYEGGLYDVEAKVAGDALEGSWQGGGYSGTLKGKRRP